VTVHKIAEQLTPENIAKQRVPDGIAWCAKHPPQHLSFLGTDAQTVARALEKTFGKFPIQLNKYEHEVSILAMGAATGLDCYAMLLAGLRQYGEIEVRLD
jgi:hypothetical protein